MTPEEIAESIIDNPSWDNTEGLHGHPVDYKILAALIAQAIRAERERCASIAQEGMLDINCTGDEAIGIVRRARDAIAAAIRAA